MTVHGEVHGPKGNSDHAKHAELRARGDLRDGPPRGTLRICSTMGFGRKVVAPLLTGFRSTYPEIVGADRNLTHWVSFQSAPTPRCSRSSSSAAYRA